MKNPFFISLFSLLKSQLSYQKTVAQFLSFSVVLFGTFFVLSPSVNAQTYEIADSLWREAENAITNHEVLKGAEFYERSAEAEQKCKVPREQDLYFELSRASYYFDQANQYDKAFELRKLSLNQCVIVFGKDHEHYGQESSWLGWYYKNNGEYQKALPLYLEAIENGKKNFEKEHPDCLVRLVNLGLLYESMAQYDSALPLYLEVIESTEKSVGKEHADYQVRLNNLAALYSSMGLNEKALPLYLEGLDYTAKSQGKGHPEYAIRLNNVGLLYESLEQYQKALPFYVEAVICAEKSIGKDHSDYGILVSNLAQLYSKLGEYNKALPFALEAVLSIEKSFGKEHSVYGTMLSNLAHLYSNMGEYEKALPIYLEALDNTEKSLGKEHSSYGTRLNNIAALYSDMGEYDKALPLYLESLKNTENSLGKDHSDYGLQLNNLVDIYNRMGQYDKALPLCLESLANCEKSVGKEHSSYGTRLNSLGFLYESMGEYDKALPLYMEALINTEKSLGKDHPTYGTRVNNLGNLFITLHQYEKALPLCLEALEITEKSLGKDHSDYGVGLNNLGLLYSRMGQYDKALSFYLEALENTKKSLGIEHSAYGTRLNNVSQLYRKTGQHAKVLPLYLEALENIYSQSEKAFSFMSENEKERFVLANGYYFNVYQSFFTTYSAKNPEVASNAYDIELATKGMILQSGIETRSAILRSGDAAALSQYDEWSLLRTQLAKQYSLPIFERRSDLKELEEKAEQAEAKLSSLSAAFQKEKANNSIRWQQVQQSLKPGEVAVEFASFDYHNDKEWTDSVMYVALLLSKGDAHPTLIPLFEEEQLDSLLTKTEDDTESSFVSDLYRGGLFDDLAANTEQKRKGKELYELIWKPLENHLNNTQTVYYTPSGRLHQISFSALPMNNDSLLSDRFHLQQLSSTTLLAKSDFRKTATSIKSAVLFGGVQYNLSADDWSAAAKNVKIEGDGLASRGLPEDLNRGNSWSYLPGSLWEVDSISSLMDQHQVSYQKFQHENALEEVIKQLSGENNPDVLHISTHGFFFPAPKKQAADNTSFIGKEHQSVHQQSDNPLFRSGLLFAGANQSWKGEKIPDGVEDGVLSAYEVSHLSLANTRLVVLSACETGLGDIKGSEGVFGLQRAFKQAGVDYILMSLWSVPDAETALFMELFYQDLLSGKSIPDAFKDAQDHMKEKYPNDPYMWAAFVLVR